MTDEFAKQRVIAEHNFDFIEYKEACNAYFQGVNIGYTVVKNFATLNVVIAIAIGALATAEVKNDFLPPPKLLANILPWIAILVSLGLALAVPTYWRHLQNCQDRCAEIERAYGGKLFVELRDIGGSKAGGGSTVGFGLNGIIYLVMGLWLMFVFRTYLLNLGFIKFIGNL